MSRSTEKLQRWIDLITFLAGRRYPVAWEEIARGVGAYARWDSEEERDREAVRRMFERDKRDLRAMGIPLELARAAAEGGRGGEGGAAGEGYLLRDRDFFLPYLTLVERAADARDGPGTPVEPSPEGAPVTDRERALMERLARRPSSPPGTVSLTPDEGAVALEALKLVEGLPGFPLAGDARSALRKLRAELGLPDPSVPLHFLERPGVGELRERVGRLAGAILDRRILRFRYRGMERDDVSHREVHPLGLLLQWGHWYLVAWDPSRVGMRLFRVGRMEGVRVAHPSAGSPEFEIPSDFRLDAWLRRPPWALEGEGGDGTLVILRFPFPLSAWAERNGHGEGVKEDADGTQLRRFLVRQRDPFLRWLLGLEGAVAVVEPAELREELTGMARAVLVACGEVVDG
jgi:predicted DNA-binding transcriptional regulator YafY